MRHIATRAARRLGLAVAATVLLAGCGGADVSVAQGPGAAAPVDASGPSPAPEVGAEPDPPQVLGEITVAPTITAAPEPDGRFYADEPQCPAPPPGLESGTPELQDAVQEIARRYEPTERGGSDPYYTGIVVCEPGDFFTVFRVPGSAVFDGGIQKVAGRHGVTVHLRDTKYSLAAIERTRTEVDARRAALERAGARLMSTGPVLRDGAYLEVGVLAKVGKAARLLADLGDRVRVVRDTGNQSLHAGGMNDRPDAVPTPVTVAEGRAAPESSTEPEPDDQSLDLTRLLPPR